MTRKVEYPNIEKSRPATCISGNMMKCNRIVANIFRKYLKPFGITDSQLSILFVVTKASEVNQKKLSDRLFMEKSTVNRNITRLMNQQYIEMNGQRYLHTTKKGKQFLEKILPHWDLAMREVQDILERDGVAALSTILNRLTQ